MPVTALQTCDYDRTLGVEIVDKESNAIEGRHYALESNTLTIKAGERVANLKVRGFYENIGITDSLGFALRLVTDESTHWDAYGIGTKVVLKKICPFDIHDFEGPAIVTSTFINQYMQNTSLRLIRTEVAEEENTILMKNYFYNGYDLKI